MQQNRLRLRARSKATEAHGSAKDAQRIYETAKAALSSNIEACKTIPGLRDRIAALNQLVGVLQARTSANKRRAAASEEHRSCEKRQVELRKQVIAAHTLLCQSEVTLAQASEALAASPFDVSLADRIDSAREAATHLQSQRKALAADREALRKLSERRAELHTTSTKAKLTADKFAKALEKATSELQAAERQVHEGLHRNSALALWQTLSPGAPCPVCEQVVVDVPEKRDSTQELDQLRSLADRARIALDAAQRESEKARDAAIQANSALEEAQQALKTTQDKVAADEADLAKAQADLEASYGEDTRDQSGDTIEHRILAKAKAMMEARKRFQTAADRHRQAELAQQKAKLEHEQSVERIATCEQRLNELINNIREIDLELTSLTEQIEAVTRDPDPVAERTRLESDMGRLEKALADARQTEGEAKIALSGAVERARQLERAAVASKEVAKKADEKLRKAALEAGFDDVDSALMAVIATSELQQIDERINEYKTTRLALEQRLKALETDLAGRITTVATMEDAEKQALEVRTKHEQSIRAEAEAKAQVEELQRRLKAAEKLIGDLNVAQQRHKIFKQLADDLRSERFLAYLLTEAFDELVRGASIRLMELSGRYTFDYRDDAFFVVDHDNAQEERSTDTLSGGETFLASLALALELSQQVQRAAGAVSLDSLFIDEGFGTLDPETLDTVAAAIESLRVGGRMIGIITHIPELTARLPERIMVQKRSEGSRVRIELD